LKRVNKTKGKLMFYESDIFQLQLNISIMTCNKIPHSWSPHYPSFRWSFPLCRFASFFSKIHASRVRKCFHLKHTACMKYRPIWIYLTWLVKQMSQEYTKLNFHNDRMDGVFDAITYESQIIFFVNISTHKWIVMLPIQ
jgi:hypothetical protein